MTSPVDPNARRRLTREEAQAQTRQRLLDAAASVFNKLGYNGASLDAVAEAAGYTRGAVYSNFATKADLFMALLERYVEGESDKQVAQLETGSIGDFIDGLDETVESQQGDREWTLLQIEFFLAAARDPVIRARYLEATAGLDDDSGRTLDGKLAEADLRPSFTGKELGILLNALAGGLALNFYFQPEALDPKLLVRATRVLFGLDPNRL